MRDYYLSGVATEVLKQIREAVENRLAVSKVWERRRFIQSVKSAAVYPSLKGISDESVLAVVYADPKIVSVGDYICSVEQEQVAVQRFAEQASSGNLDIDFFLPSAYVQITPLFF